jgi:uncharacterized membrane protein
VNGHALHLAINHFPIVLSIVGAAAALVAFVTRRRSALLYALTTMIAAGVTAYPAQFTGERAEDAVESRWYVDDAVIHEHEESGERATLILVIGGVVAAVALYLVVRSPREAMPGMAMLTTILVLSVSGAVAAGLTGWRGGAIVSRNARLSGGVEAPRDSARVLPDSGVGHDAHDGH